jgi:hypothetical protein
MTRIVNFYMGKEGTLLDAMSHVRMTAHILLTLLLIRMIARGFNKRLLLCGKVASLMKLELMHGANAPALEP